MWQTKLDLNETNEHGFTALHLCAQEKLRGDGGRYPSLDLLVMLIKEGADLNTSADADHLTPLMQAVMSQNISAGTFVCLGAVDGGGERFAVPWSDFALLPQCSR